MTTTYKNTIDTWPADMQAEMRAVAMDENRWPCWPLLPVKRYQVDASDLEIAVVLARSSSREPFKVQHRLMFDKVTPQTKVTTYTTLDELFADGWVVD